MNKTQCEIHSKEIDTARERIHNNSNEISKLKLQHEVNECGIEKLDKKVEGVANEQIEQGKTMAVAVNNIGDIKKMLNKGVWALVAAMITIIVNTYFTFTS